MLPISNPVSDKKAAQLRGLTRSDNWFLLIRVYIWKKIWVDKFLCVHSAQKWATPTFGFCEKPIFLISASEGRRDFSETPKCSQWPHLYWTYEATYTLKCLFFEKIKKNWFFTSREAKISFLKFSRKLSSLSYMLLHNANINMTIAHILVYLFSL